MKTVDTISVENWPDLINLERLFYEKQSYENLLSYMTQNNIQNTSTYFDEYKEVIEEYVKLCKKLEKEIIIPVIGDTTKYWEVDFIDKVVEIREITG